ncbi:MAG: hypothetical protein NC081_08165 [Roseburia sp.]|nr:hypothetical protein [Roseburia sp.]
MVKNRCRSLCALFMILCLAGCGKGMQGVEGIQGSNTAQRQETEQKEEKKSLAYGITYQDTHSTPEISADINSFQMTEKALYFKAVGSGSFYRISLEEEILQPRVLPIELLADEIFLALCVTEGQYGGIFISSYDREKQAYYLTAYDENGSLSWRQDITEAVPEAEKNEYGGSFWYLRQDSEGMFYMPGEKHILLFDREGKGRGEILWPYERLENIVVSKEGRVYGLSGNSGSGRALTELDTDNLTCGEEIRIRARVLAAGLTEGICYVDEITKSLYEYSPNTGESRELLSVLDYNMTEGAIWLCCAAGDSIRFLVRDTFNASAPVELITLAKGAATAAGQKQKLIVLASSDNLYLMNKAAAFNRRNDAYEVTVEVLESSNGSGNAYSYDELMTKLNTKILSKEVDLIFVNQLEYCTYKEQNAFENLIPFLKDSRIRVEDYRETLLMPLRKGAELYSIPTFFTVQSYALKESQLGDEEICTMEGFLRYIEEHQNMKWKWGGSGHWVLEMCMKFGWEHFVNLGEGSCSFDQEEFKSLVKRINALELDAKWYHNEWEELIGEGENVMSELTFSSPIQIAGEERYYGEELSLIGYPSPDGELRTYAFLDPLLCISARSGRKEGAFAFWEYYMEASRQDAGRALSARTDDFEEQMEMAGTKQYEWDERGDRIELPVDYLDYGGEMRGYYALNERQQSLVEQAIENARTDTVEGLQIQKLVLEEMDSYLYGNKSLEEAAGILQNRVQLYLNERK